jgi:Terminase large subunit, T4likevirus-type, N-terminal
VPSAIPGCAAFASKVLHFTPDAIQTELLNSSAKQGLLNCTRQWGKSTVAAIKAVHRAHFTPDSLILVASPTERQSAEFLRKARHFAQALQPRLTGDGHNRVSLLFPNGSRIVGLPGTEATIRGFSAASLVILDEASRISDDLYKALSPILTVSGGDLWLLSTPCGKRGIFYELWQHGGDQWTRFEVPATQCPRISPERLDQQRAQLGDMWFRQEYLCEFVSAGTQFFPTELVEAAVERFETWHFS